MEQIDFEKLKERPHLFILGAGATKATIPFGDINGLKSPVMEDFLAVTGLSYILKDIALRTASNNIEDIYSELYETNQLELIDEIEKGIISYYSKMQIPAKPTLYDYLILFLRSKDCIATFNWDPLLLQAYNRVNQITKDLPQLIFLHGSVAVGLCKTCMRYEPLQNVTCSKCGKPLVMSKLLYPVKNKDYQSDIFIHHSWSELEYYLVIVKPDINISTSTAYAKAESIEKKNILAIERINTALKSGDLSGMCNNLFNCFEDVVNDPEVFLLKDKMRKLGAKGTLMTGSGSAVFGIFEDAVSAQRCQKIMKQDYEKVFLCKPVSHGVIIDN